MFLFFQQLVLIWVYNRNNRLKKVKLLNLKERFIYTDCIKRYSVILALSAILVPVTAIANQTEIDVSDSAEFSSNIKNDTQINIMADFESPTLPGANNRVQNFVLNGNNHTITSNQATNTDPSYLQFANGSSNLTIQDITFKDFQKRQQGILNFSASTNALLKNVVFDNMYTVDNYQNTSFWGGVIDFEGVLEPFRLPPLL